MKVAIVGSRDYPEPSDVASYVRRLAYSHEELTVISGGARGPDTWAVQEANRLGTTYIEYEPDWETHGKAAGAIRNRQIVEAADKVVAFWDGESKGTKITIDLALKLKKDLEVYFA